MQLVKMVPMDYVCWIKEKTLESLRDRLLKRIMNCLTSALALSAQEEDDEKIFRADTASGTSKI